MALMADELSAFVIRDFQVQMSFRTSLDADFPLPTATGLGLEALQGSDGVSPAPDGLTVYVTRPSFIGVSYRPTASSPFTSVSQVNVDAGAIGSPRARLSADSMTLYWSTPDHTFHEAQRLAGTRDVFITALEFTTIEVLDFAISADDLTLYWSSSSPGGDIYVSTRPSKGQPFGPGIPVENVNSSFDDVPLFVTQDGCELYFRTNRTSFESIWVARRSY